MNMGMAREHGGESERERGRARECKNDCDRGGWDAVHCPQCMHPHTPQ